MVQQSKIVMVGCLESGWEVVRFLLEHGVRMDYFVTISREKAVQQQVAGYASFEDLAAQHGILVYTAEKYSLKGDRDIAFFREHRFDLVVQGGWQRLFPKEILQTLSVGAVGIHGSADFLPKGRGRSPINWSLIEGRQRFILHYFLMRAGVDDGDVFHYETFDINAWDTCRTLYYKNSLITQRALLEWIPKLLAGRLKVYSQQGMPTYYPKRSPEDGRIDWARDVFAVYNFIRALTAPYPGAFTMMGPEKLTIWKAQPFDTRIGYFEKQQGEVVEVFKTGDAVVNCSGGLLLITEYEGSLRLDVGMLLT